MLTVPKQIRTPVIMRSPLMLETANEWRDKPVLKAAALYRQERAGDNAPA